MWYLLRRPLFTFNEPVKYLCKQCSRNLFHQSSNKKKFDFIFKQKPRTDFYFYISKKNVVTSVTKNSIAKNTKKFNKSEVKRLISLMKSEKWKLTGTSIITY